MFKENKIMIGDLLEGKTSAIRKDYISLYPHSVEDLNMTAAEYHENTLEEVMDSVTVDGFNGEPLTLEQFDKATKHGCSHCGTNAFFGEEIHWMSADSFLCDGCMQSFNEYCGAH